MNPVFKYGDAAFLRIKYLKDLLKNNETEKNLK